MGQGLELRCRRCADLRKAGDYSGAGPGGDRRREWRLAAPKGRCWHHRAAIPPSLPAKTLQPDAAVSRITFVAIRGVLLVNGRGADILMAEVESTRRAARSGGERSPPLFLRGGQRVLPATAGLLAGRAWEAAEPHVPRSAKPSCYDPCNALKEALAKPPYGRVRARRGPMCG